MQRRKEYQVALMQVVQREDTFLRRHRSQTPVPAKCTSCFVLGKISVAIKIKHSLTSLFTIAIEETQRESRPKPMTLIWTTGTTVCINI